MPPLCNQLCIRWRLYIQSRFKHMINYRPCHAISHIYIYIRIYIYISYGNHGRSLFLSGMMVRSLEQTFYTLYSICIYECIFIYIHILMDMYMYMYIYIYLSYTQCQYTHIHIELSKYFVYVYTHPHIQRSKLATVWQPHRTSTPTYL